MGNKKKLIARGLTDLFPKDIDTFVDLFAGSGTVSINTMANTTIINDINPRLYDLYQFFKTETSEEIICKIDKYISDFGLARERTKRNVYQDKVQIAKYKKAYLEFRDFYNSYPDNFKLLTLMFYSFSQQMRFNDKGKFNMPCGNDFFSDKNKDYIRNGCRYFMQENVILQNKDFRGIDLSGLLSDDFVYIDPPYIGTTATYTENGGWSEADEYDLHKLCEQLTAMNVKFALSNVFKNKGVVNQQLIDWVENNEYYVHYFDGFNYMACGKGNAKTIEVLITNYKTGEKINE